MSEWQPIETAPKDEAETPIDLWVVHPQKRPEGMRSADMVWSLGEWRTDFLGEPLNGGWVPTHWMPLPEPPRP